jgi:RNA polymerase sigma-70 factor (ECF subfamily)
MTGSEDIKEPASEAIPRLFRDHGELLYNLGLKFCGSADEAQDLVQDVFLSAFKNWEQFDGRSKPTTWLYTIAARACQRRHRLRAGEPSHMDSLEDLLPGGDVYVPDLASSDSDAFHRANLREACASLEGAITKLPPEFRMTLLLKDVVELSVAEVAQALDIKPATVKTRVHRARLLLRKELAERFPDRPAAAAEQPANVCYDLLQAKLDAMDRGVEFELPEEALCGRCTAVFAALDLNKQACEQLEREALPPQLKKSLQVQLGAR